MKLSKRKSISDEFEFDGIKNILIVGGKGKVFIERSIMGSKFYPLSHNGVFELNGSCAYNGTIQELGSRATYRIRVELEDGSKPVEVFISR